MGTEENNENAQYRQYLTTKEKIFLEEILEGKHVKQALSEEDKDVLKTIIRDFSNEKR